MQIQVFAIKSHLNTYEIESAIFSFSLEEESELSQIAAITGFPIYTVVDTNEGCNILLPGFHHVNRIGYALVDVASEDEELEFGKPIEFFVAPEPVD